MVAERTLTCRRFLGKGVGGLSIEHAGMSNVSALF